MKDNFIIKRFSEIADIDESKGIIQGYANVYNIKDHDGDISMPGSFTKTITERKDKIRIFKNHEPILVGVPKEFDTADPYGLKMTAQMIMTTPVGRDTFYELKFLNENGAEAGFSIGGWIMKRGKNKGEVAEYKLKEVSALTTSEPANQYSLIDTVKAVKELTEPTQDEFWRVITKAYDDKFSDGMLKSLETFLSLKDTEPSGITETTLINEPSEAIITSIYELLI